MRLVSPFPHGQRVGKDSFIYVQYIPPASIYYVQGCDNWAFRYIRLGLNLHGL